MGYKRARFIYPKCREHRESLGWTIADLARQSSVSRDLISKVENNGRATRPKLIKLFRTMNSKLNCLDENDEIKDSIMI